MGLFWDLIQQSQISTQRDRADSMDSRVATLELELQAMKIQFRDLVTILEREYGKDLDGDGRVGAGKG